MNKAKFQENRLLVPYRNAIIGIGKKLTKIALEGIRLTKHELRANEGDAY